MEDKGLPIGCDDWNSVGRKQKTHAYAVTSSRSSNFGHVDDEDIVPHNRRNQDVAEKNDFVTMDYGHGVHHGRNRLYGASMERKYLF